MSGEISDKAKAAQGFFEEPGPDFMRQYEQHEL